MSGLDRDLALSPDGRHLVYRAGGSNTAGSPLMVRAIDQLDAQPARRTSVAHSAPFFSPDSRWIGFFENTDLKKVSIAGGPAITLGPVSGSTAWRELGRRQHDRVRHQRPAHRSVARVGGRR